ncbi:sensor histidine kinase [Citricoccus alkalitolerans]|uniref:histidine kinase n=1 Tax=Citricoccus alkalitolerans TaxID=246603 RepID=A0ABV8XXJ7_9MICC
MLTSCAAVVLIATGWPILAAVHHVHVAIAMVLAIGQAAAVPLAVRRPILAILLGTAAALGTMSAVDLGSAPWPWPVTTLIAYVLLILVVSVRHSWRLGAAGWLAGAVVGGLGLALIPDTELPPGMVISNVTTVASLTGGALAVGSGVRLLVSSRGQLDHERQLTAEEETKRRELQQRNRIAQELHDVVAHSMSVISVQATTAPYRLPGMDEPTRGEFDSIADSSRRALTEMRGLLAILRGDDAADTTPQPTIADIPQLVATTRSSGARVELEIDPELLPLPLSAATAASGSGGPGVASAAGDWSAVVPPATGLTAYRVVQEAVSNALRHAPGAAIRVQVSVGDQIGVRIANGPAARRGSVAAPGAGLGLKGIRERVGALGGTVKTGPTPEGGFTVKARLPL